MSAYPAVVNSSLPGPQDITRTVLPNGITVLARSNFNSQSVVISGYLQSGSIFDPAGKLGLANFTSLVLMRGTARRTFQQIYDELESVGASLGFNASVHNTGFGGRCLAEDLPMLLSLLSESLQQPVFPPADVERVRAQLLTRLAMRDQDTGDVADLAFEKEIFGDHPYGCPEDGNPETVRPITRDELADFHRRHYGPRGMVVAVVGAVSGDQAVDLVHQALGSWENTDQEPYPPLPEIKPLAATVRRHIPLPGKFQTDLVMGTIGPRRSSPHFHAASLGNSVLGQFGMMGRIGDVVREQSGLAYYASTSLNAWIDAGSWEISAGVNPANLQKAIDLILSELRKFVENGVSQEELKDSQTNFIGRLPLSLESNSGVANALLNIERFELGLDYYQRYADLISAVTPEMVLEAARAFIDPDKLAIISCGPEG